MKCVGCKKNLSVKELVVLSIKGRTVCSGCSKLLILKNRAFILFLLVVLLVFMGLTAYFFAINSSALSISWGWRILSYFIPLVLFLLFYGILVVPAMEVKEDN